MKGLCFLAAMAAWSLGVVYGEGLMSLSLSNDAEIHSPAPNAPLNPGNELSIPEWEGSARILFSGSLDLTSWLTLSVAGNSRFFHLRSLQTEEERRQALLLSPSAANSILSLDGASAKLYLPAAYLAAEIGRFLPRLGPQYLFRPMDVFADRTAGKSLTLASLLVFAGPVTIGGYYAPMRCWAVQDFPDADAETSDFWAAGVSTVLGPHAVDLVAGHMGQWFAGLSYSGQIGEALIPYGSLSGRETARAGAPVLDETLYTVSFPDAVDPALRGNVGLQFSPDGLPWTLYAEAAFATDGRDPSYWKEVNAVIQKMNPWPSALEEAARGNRAAILSHFDFMDESPLCFGLHVRQNDRELLFDALGLSGTVIYGLYSGLYASLEAELHVSDALELNGSVRGFIPQSADSELAFVPTAWVIGVGLRFVFT